MNYGIFGGIGTGGSDYSDGYTSEDIERDAAEARRSVRNFTAHSYVGRIDPAKEGGYVATFPDLNGCVMEGETLREVESRARDALKVYINSALSNGDTLPKPKYRMRRDLKVSRTFKVTLTLGDIAKGLGLPETQ